MATTYDPSPPRLLEPIPPSRRAIHAFLSRHLDLLVAERQAEIDQTSLLASKCSPKLLEKRGLAIRGQYCVEMVGVMLMAFAIGLGVSNVSVGLGGKT
jgi:DNA polymerase alpha-associated DNA helicase A